jgi:hypothetical protein
MPPVKLLCIWNLCSSWKCSLSMASSLITTLCLETILIQW